MRKAALCLAMLVATACGSKPMPTEDAGPTPISESDRFATIDADRLAFEASAAETSAVLVPDVPVGRNLNSNYDSIALNLRKSGFKCGDGVSGMTCTQGSDGVGMFTVTAAGIADNTSPNELVLVATGASPALFSDVAAAVAHTVLFEDAERREATKVLAGKSGAYTVGDVSISTRMGAGGELRMRIVRP